MQGTRGERFMNAIRRGFITARAVLEARDGIKLGKWVTVKEQPSNPFYAKRTISGRVCYVNEHFFVLQTKKYKEAFSFIDLAIGKIKLL